MELKKRLISLDETLNATYKEVYWTESEAAAIRSFLVKQPKVDAVEVVRCKDCENWQKPWLVDQTLGVCQVGKKSLTEPNHFCSYGERKDNG